MANLSLENVPDDLVEQLRERARRNRRSLNREAVVCLEEALRTSPVDPDAMLAKLARLREGLDLPPLTDEAITAARSEGRP